MKALIGDLPFRDRLIAGEAGVFISTNQHARTRLNGIRPELVIARGGSRWPQFEPLHVMVCATAWGAIPDGGHVHHIDHNRWNNEPHNLVALPRAVHKAWHRFCKEAPTERPQDVLPWTTRATLAFMHLPQDRRGRIWSRMVLNLPAWLAAEFDAREAPAHWRTGAHFDALGPLAQRVIVSHCKMLLAVARHKLKA